MKSNIDSDIKMPKSLLSPKDEKDYEEFVNYCIGEFLEILEIFGKSQVYSMETEYDEVKVRLAKLPKSHIPDSGRGEELGRTAEERFKQVKSKYLGILHLNDEKDVPFVKVGDKVKEGQILAIVQTMNIANEVRANWGGKIIEILEDDGKPVEYGQTLFVIDTMNGE